MLECCKDIGEGKFVSFGLETHASRDLEGIFLSNAGLAGFPKGMLMLAGKEG